MRIGMRIRSIAAGALLAGLMSGTASAQQVVRFLHNETDPPSIAFFNNAIKAFEAENPGVKIEMEAISTDGRLQKVMSSITTKTMPDLFKLLPEERFEFARKGYLVELDDVLKSIGEQDYVPGALVKVSGKTYDLPYTLGNFSVFWNRADLLKAKGLETPKNWDELKSAAAALTAGDQFGFVFPAGKNRMTSVYLSQMIWAAGGTYFDKDLNVTFNNPGTVKALQFLKDMAKFSPPGISSYSYSEMINSYLTGKIGLDIYAPRLAANAFSNAPDVFAKTNGAPVPAGPSGVGVKFVNSNSFAVASAAVGAKNIEGAKKFLQYLITGDRLRDFSMTAYPHLVPPLKSVQDKVVEAGAKELGGRQELARLAFDTSNSLDFDSEAGAVVKDGKVVKSGVINPYIGSIVARGIPAAVVQRVVLEGEDPAKAAAWGHDQMKRVVDELKKN
ncbi:sugar ABC transporter substrate-binding protein [Alsobacter sp. SYSU M60028]|uniref:Sugar ABC transporter substrate-binding protein n=1 Tax=Alsobacter ponti TaxID=2962936 RepID=A0ABT1LGY4_9HYPH|nr:sugar ABC transporter substrate-binding protein [Alsobacter ponti]MCP8939980.1 sugar ABC transporter substrate-binding protein [Alsobacter ponti]